MAQIQFKGKSLVWNHHFGVEYHELVPDKSKSLTDKVSLKDNLIIHGDNLKALKALLPTYAGKVKCIYIDPPYNTGNEGWAYSDNVSSPMIKEWLGKVVDKDDLTRHDKWLCMMTPRLKLLRELLADDGVIFISIGDEEVGNLRLLVDEVFGEENFVADIVWQRAYSPVNMNKYFSQNHDFMVCYAKNRDDFRVNFAERTEEQSARYKNPDNDPHGPWKSVDFSVGPRVETNAYEITTPSGRKVTPPAGRSWVVNEIKFKELIADNRIWFGENKSNVPALKKYLDEVKEGVVPLTLWTYEEVGHTQDAKKELKATFGDDLFATPKPTSLIKRILELSTNKDSLVLDSFAGSGTTAQAVLELNKEDGGNRKFILVEMEDYADKITAERVRRVIKGVPGAKNESLKKGLGGSFSYFTLGDAIDEVGILSGKSLPSYEQMARYLYYTATGEEFDEKQVSENKNFIGKSKDYEVYLYYKPDIEYLKSTAFNLDKVEALPAFSGKRRLVFAPAKYLDQEHLDKFHIDFAQLPFEIYRKGN
jgi:adenine-specific DNA-methyltransferase